MHLIFLLFTKFIFKFHSPGLIKSFRQLLTEIFSSRIIQRLDTFAYVIPTLKFTFRGSIKRDSTKQKDKIKYSMSTRVKFDKFSLDNEMIFHILRSISCIRRCYDETYFSIFYSLDSGGCILRRKKKERYKSFFISLYMHLKRINRNCTIHETIIFISKYRSRSNAFGTQVPRILFYFFCPPLSLSLLCFALSLFFLISTRDPRVSINKTE